MRFRLAFDRRGQMRVIESIMASLLIVFAVVFVDLFAVTPVSPKYESGELEKIGFNVLHDLDEQELLGRFIGNGEWANLTSALAASLPTDVYFNLTVYDMAGTVVNSVPIGYGTSRVFSNSTYVASVTYVVPGYQMLYRPRVLVLQIVRG
jgi:predicted secreted protein